MASQPTSFVTPEEYLEWEIRNEEKNEYLNGQIFAMAGVSLQHNRIVQDINRRLGNQLEGSPCEVHAGDLRVRTSGASMYTYPDVVVFCGQPQLQAYKGTDTLANPCFILEVLSPSTERYDRRIKFQMYREIASLQEYVLVSQEKVLVERYVRQPDGEWQYSALDRLTDPFPLSSLPAVLNLQDIYARVFLAADVRTDENG